MSVVVPSLRPAIAVPGWAKNELWRKAKAVPSLDLRFADNKSLVDATTGQNLVTFSRASGGTYFDSQGVLRTALVNEPRFDHNPTTGESLGLLVEELRRNLLLSSAALVTQTVTVAAVAHTLSFYGTGSVALSGTHVATVNGSGAYPTRTTLTFTPTAGSLTLTVTGAVQYANLEEGSFATSYIENVNTPGGVTRAADVAIISGSNFSSWYRQDEGTVFAKCNVFGDNKFNQFIYSSSDGAIGDEIRLFKTSGNNSISSALEDSVGGTTNNIFGNTDTPFGSPWKTAHAFAANYAIRAVNGINSSADTTVTVPVVNRMRIGARMNETFYANLHLSRLTYWPQRLPNTTLQTITL